LKDQDNLADDSVGDVELIEQEVPLRSVTSHRVNQNGSIEFEVEYEDTPDNREWVFAREFMDPQTPP
jgi:hypothetical protein